MTGDILSKQFWLMEPNFLKGFLENIQGKCYADVIEIEARASEFEKTTSGLKPYKIDNNIAVIDIRGPLLKRVPWILSFLFGIQSMESIGAAFNVALDDKDVDGIFLHVDSPGSEVDGVQTLSDTIFQGRGKKPVLSFIDGSGTSGAFWIASAANQIVLADSTSRLGSVGIIGIHQQVTEMAKKMGVGLHVFSAGEFKASGSQFQPLSEKDIKYIDSQFTYLHNIFIAGVEKNLARKLASDAKEARIYLGQQAVDAGLANSIMTKKQAMAKLKSMAGSRGFTSHSKYNSSAQGKGTNMKITNATLLDIVKEVQATTDIDALAKLEQDLVQECSRRKSVAQNWIQQNEAEGLRNSIVKLVSQQRRMLLAQPKVLERQKEVDLGQSIGRAVFPGRCKV